MVAGALRAAAAAVSAAHGEAVQYRIAGGATLSVPDAIVERQPPGQDTPGGTQATTLSGQIWIRRELLAQPQVGRDKVVLVWTDGTTREALVATEIQHSRGLWHLGFVL